MQYHTIVESRVHLVISLINNITLNILNIFKSRIGLNRLNLIFRFFETSLMLDESRII